MAHWRPDFDDVPEKERLALLRSATQWADERNSKPGPHVRVDEERHASLTKELIEWLEAPEAAAKAAASARDVLLKNRMISSSCARLAKFAVVHRPSTHAAPCKQWRVVSEGKNT